MNRFFSEFVHFVVGIDFILNLLPEFHLFALSLAEGSIGVSVVVVWLLPEHAEERSVASLLTLALPIL